MKIEIKREQRDNLDIYIYVYVNGKSIQAFYVGTAIDFDLQNNERIKHAEAKDWVEKAYLQLGKAHVTILETIEI